MAGWTPLFQKMIHSSIWDESDHVRLAWISILITTEKDGICPIKTAKGLASVARITEENAVDALRVLSEPDKNTLNQEWEGRRIEITPDGIRILNWQKYREKAQSQATRESNRLAQEKFRRKQKATQHEESEDDTEQNASWSGRDMR